MLSQIAQKHILRRTQVIASLLLYKDTELIVDKKKYTTNLTYKYNVPHIIIHQLYIKYTLIFICHITSRKSIILRSSNSI